MNHFAARVRGSHAPLGDMLRTAPTGPGTCKTRVNSYPSLLLEYGPGHARFTSGCSVVRLKRGLPPRTPQIRPRLSTGMRARQAALLKGSCSLTSAALPKGGGTYR